MAELADAIDSKSIVLRTSPFESGQGHHPFRNPDVASLATAKRVVWNYVSLKTMASMLGYCVKKYTENGRR